jgi:hypothetical protein
VSVSLLTAGTGLGCGRVVFELLEAAEPFLQGCCGGDKHRVPGAAHALHEHVVDERPQHFDLRADLLDFVVTAHSRFCAASAPVKPSAVPA